MVIAVLLENKNEYRVGLVPTDVNKLFKAGHEVRVQTLVGAKAGFYNDEYSKAGAIVMNKTSELLANAQCVIKLSSLTKKEMELIDKNNAVVISNLNLANNPQILKQYLKNNINSLGLELVNEEGRHIFQISNEQVKGKFGVLTGTYYLSNLFNKDSFGKSLGQITGVEHNTEFVLINHSYASYEAIKIILALGANATLLESDEQYVNELQNDNALHALYKATGGKLTIVPSSFDELTNRIKKADVLIDTTQIPGSLTKLRITTEMILSMHKGAVYVDLGADQGFGSDATVKPNDRKHPYTLLNGIICVAFENIPSFFPNSMSICASEIITKMCLKHSHEQILD
jgi:alanine dehydrogenase